MWCDIIGYLNFMYAMSAINRLLDGIRRQRVLICTVVNFEVITNTKKKKKQPNNFINYKNVL